MNVVDDLSGSPQNRYRNAPPAERRRIQSEVVAAHRDHVSRLVRRLVRGSQYWREAEQVGAIGILVALEKYDPERLGEDRGAAFWFFASRYVRDEIQRWMDHGVFWRPRTRKLRNGADDTVARSQRSVAELDETVVEAAAANVEELVADAESKARLREFAATLSSEENEILFSDNSQRVRSRRYLLLVERACAFVKGDGGNEPLRSGRTR